MAQKASAKAEGLLATNSVQEGALAEHSDEGHTLPAQSPQKVVSNTCAGERTTTRRRSADCYENQVGCLR